MFKAGDKIMCIDNSGKSGFLIKGKIYTVIDVTEKFVYLPGGNGYFHSRFISYTPLLAELF